MTDDFVEGAPNSPDPDDWFADKPESEDEEQPASPAADEYEREMFGASPAARSESPTDYGALPPMLEWQPEPSFWQSLRRRLWPSRDERDQEYRERLEELDEAIARHPEAAANYVCRGEIYLENSQPERAAADFERALALAAQEFEERRWGIVAQTLQDRARRGLQVARKRSGKR